MKKERGMERKQGYGPFYKAFSFTIFTVGINAI
jgi:hypothetical protein